jgi:hypothetical protein
MRNTFIRAVLETLDTAALNSVYRPEANSDIARSKKRRSREACRKGTRRSLRAHCPNWAPTVRGLEGAAVCV